MLKNYNYILTIIFYPFILLLCFLICRGFLKSPFYIYLTIFMVVIFIPSFVMSLYGVIEEILNSKRKLKIILLILFPFFYLPIYYTKYVYKEEKYLGFIICLLSIIVSYLAYTAFNTKLYNYLIDACSNSIIVREDYSYTSVNNLFKMRVSKDFRCNDSDVGDYVIYCDKLGDDSFVGVYSYDVMDYSEDEIIDILKFHLNQSLNYIKESGYAYEVENIEDDIIRISYQDMVILLTQKNYFIDDTEYSLIIIKEVPKDLEILEDYQKMIESIEFLNYNEEVSS